MRFVSRKYSVPVISILLLLIISASPVSAQGFGWLKKKTTLQLKSPPIVYLTGTDFDVHVAQNPVLGRDVTRTLRDSLFSGLPQFDRRLHPDTAKPETVIEVRIIELSSSSRIETRSTTEYKQTGSTTQVDPDTNTTVMVPVYGDVTVYYDVTVIEGQVIADYECRDAATGTVIDADRITSSDRSEHSGSPPSKDNFERMLLNALAGRVGSRFQPQYRPGPTILLPTGKLEKASELIRKKSWNSALEALNRLGSFKNESEEAYRQYALGVVFEALAYDGPDVAGTWSYLQYAVSYYDEAVTRTPTVPEFQSSRRRAGMMYSSYKRIETDIAAYEAARRARPQQAVPSAYRSGSLANSHIVSLAKSGTSEKEILAKVKRSRGVSFDLSIDAMSELSAAGVSARVIDAMRESMRPRVSRPSRWRNILWLTAFGYYLLPILVAGH